MLEKHQLTRPNFNEWFRALKLVVHTEKLHDVFETALPPAPAVGANAQALADWAVLFYRHNEVACLMLGTMSPKLYHQFEHNSPLEMVTKLHKMYGKSPGVELQELMKMFHSSFVQNYNMQSMEKTISEVHSLLIEFEKSIKRNKQPIVGASFTPQVMANQGGRVQKDKLQGKAKGKYKGKGLKKSYHTKPKKHQPYKKERPAKDGQCHHYKEEGHWKRNCPVYLAELMKKKKKTRGQNVASTSSGIYTIELTAFHKNSWVYDTGCGTHICNTKQGLRGAKKLKRGSLYLYVGNGVRAEVEAIGSFDFVLPNGLIIVLDNYFGLSVSMNKMLYFNAITVNGIYEIDMRDSTFPIINSMYSIRNKRTKSNLDSTYLWHCRLAHINKKYIEKLQHDGLLKSTDNEPFDQCVSCISGKMTRKPFSHKTEKVKDVLGLIHTDVCGPLRHVSKKGASYFITFTDDYSRYGYVYLLKHKHEVFETFKDYALESAARILNMVWGCEAHVKRHTPDKLQQRSVKCIFVGYPKETMGYYFYYPPENKIVVERYAYFLDNDFILQKESVRIVELEDEDILPSENTSEHPIEEEKIDPDRLCFNVEVEEHNLGDLNEPANYKAALSDPEFEKWLVAMNAEMQSMYDNKVWRLVVLPPNAKVVKSKRIYKKKTDMDGKVHIYKARLVAKGSTQTYGVDYEETFSLVADIRAIRILIAIVAYYDYEIWKMNVKIAFLNGFLEEEIYMEQPEGFIDPNHPRKVCKLQRSIYGLKQASRSWNKRFDEEIKKFGFHQNVDEPCVYQEASGSNNTKRHVFLVYGGNPEAELQVKCYCDAGFETDRDDTKSQTGYVFVLNGGAVVWKSSKQSTTAQHATEAEYIAASEAAKEAVWTKTAVVTSVTTADALDKG
ncbi:retrotransposon protein, putative, ty1-copia subclass [Tanacetum coccineum]